MYTISTFFIFHSPNYFMNARRILSYGRIRAMQKARINHNGSEIRKGMDAAFESGKGSGLWRRLEKYEEVVGKEPTKTEFKQFVKRCALEDLREQLGREPTREEKIAHLKVVKTVVWKENHLELIKAIYERTHPF